MYQGGDCKFSCTLYSSDASLVILHELHQERWQTVVTQVTWVVVQRLTLWKYLPDWDFRATDGHPTSGEIHVSISDFGQTPDVDYKLPRQETR